MLRSRVRHTKENPRIFEPFALIRQKAATSYSLHCRGSPRRTSPHAWIAKTYPSSCGEYAFAAIAPTQRLFAAAWRAGLPIFYSTGETRPDASPAAITTTQRRGVPADPAVFEIRAEFAPQPGDTVVRKLRASAFYGTPLPAHLTRLGVQSIIMCGESTSGSVRASAVDAYSNGFHVTLAEECCFDRHLLSHKINLFDLHHK
jgi:maleamate amidohydrolase